MHLYSPYRYNARSRGRLGVLQLLLVTSIWDSGLLPHVRYSLREKVHVQASDAHVWKQTWRSAHCYVLSTASTHDRHPNDYKYKPWIAFTCESHRLRPVLTLYLVYGSDKRNISVIKTTFLGCVRSNFLKSSASNLKCSDKVCGETSSKCLPYFCAHKSKHLILKLNSVTWVHEWTVPTERPLLVGEDSANFCG
jgi:hypothetical protein